MVVPKFVFDMPKTWAEWAAVGLPGGRGSAVPPPTTGGAPEVEMIDVGSTTGGGVKGRKWGLGVTNARSLVIHVVSGKRGVAALWHQASRLRDGAGKTIVGVW